MQEKRGAVMKIFLTGASGFIGSAVLKRLVEAGHIVKGLVQNDAKADIVRRGGGVPVIGDLLVPGPWEDAVKDCDLVISASSPFGITEALTFREAERRAASHAEMVGNLLHAARQSSVQAAILTNHVTAFGNHGDSWASEILTVNPVGLARPVAGSYWEIEKAAKKAEVPTIEVFTGWVYGPGSWFEKLVMAGLNDGTLKVVGAGTNFKSLVHIDDVAEGFRLIVDKMPIGERFCLVDNHPVTQREFLNLVAREMGMRSPDNVDYMVFAKARGEVLAEALDSSVRVTNNKARNELGFKPMYPTCDIGVPEALKALGIMPKSGEMRRASGF